VCAMAINIFPRSPLRLEILLTAQVFRISMKRTFNYPRSRRHTMRSILKTLPALLVLAAGPAPVEAPTGFDNLTNGLTDDQTHAKDKDVFDEAEKITPNGLGPVYNAQSCRECHQNPVSGAASRWTWT